MEQTNVFDIAIIGAGSVGMAAGAYAAKENVKTLLIDAYDPPHMKGSHHGDTRMIRQAYGEGRDYVRLAKRAQFLWEQLAKESGETILEKVGVVGVGPKQSAFVRESIASAKENDLLVEVLTGEEINKRWKGFTVPDDYIGYYEPDTGFIYCEKAMKAYKNMAIHHGATYRPNTKVEKFYPNEEGFIYIETNSETYIAKKVIVTAGAYAKQLLQHIDLPIVPTRKCFAFFEAEEEIYSKEHFPCFYIEDETETYGAYGFPNINETGLKIGRDDGGMPMDPEKLTQDFGTYPSDEADLRYFLERFIPGANNALKEGKTCLYTNSADEHFIIDVDPQSEHIFYACGFSGHGFKFASSIGEALVKSALEGKLHATLDMFRLERFTAR
ncbi:N-methyl-L-tryptophan oxidase [Pseudogracilibacillus sp. ICA-222130]|uniref:N-methyl-L-tryptophan oxidase n=1 Tax=Pseudogracilibacillus sp. ICA-222130 TaxID=3134655 RepID=UPI0030C58E13